MRGPGTVGTSSMYFFSNRIFSCSVIVAKALSIIPVSSGQSFRIPNEKSRLGSGLGAAVFPDSAQGGIEPGVQLESLFAA